MHLFFHELNSGRRILRIWTRTPPPLPRRRLLAPFPHHITLDGALSFHKMDVIQLPPSHGSLHLQGRPLPQVLPRESCIESSQACSFPPQQGFLITYFPAGISHTWTGGASLRSPWCPTCSSLCPVQVL